MTHPSSSASPPPSLPPHLDLGFLLISHHSAHVAGPRGAGQRRREGNDGGEAEGSSLGMSFQSPAGKPGPSAGDSGTCGLRPHHHRFQNRGVSSRPSRSRIQRVSCDRAGGPSFIGENSALRDVRVQNTILYPVHHHSSTPIPRLHSAPPPPSGRQVRIVRGPCQTCGCTSQVEAAASGFQPSLHKYNGEHAAGPAARHGFRLKVTQKTPECHSFAALWSETVLHQFCCPAPEHTEADTTGSSGGQMLSLEDGTSSGGGQEVEGPKREGPSEYEISLENKNKQIEELEQKYGGHLIARRAARRIQTAFRQYQLSKNFQKIRNSLSESKLPRRISLRHPSPSGRNRNSTQRHSYSLHPGGGQIPLRSKTPPPPPCRSTSLPPSPASAPATGPSPAPGPAPPQTPGQTLTQLEDCFSEQLHSLAQSIDDALRGWSLSEGGEGKGLLMDPGALRAAAESACLPRSASSLLMAFRDVTVHIDSNSSYTISSATTTTTTSLGNAGGGEPGSRKTSVSGMAGGGDGLSAEEPEFPAPPPSEELEMADIGSRRGSAVPAPGGGGMEGESGSDRLGSTSTSTSTSTSISTSAQSNQQPAQIYTQYQQYHYTHPQQIPGGPSPEALQALVVSLPRDRCQDPASCRSPTLSTDTHRKRLYRIGLNLFNVNPERGIHFLITRGFVPDTAIGVAHFLLQRKGLSRQMIGEFLGNSKLQFNRDVLDCVVDEMDFSGMELDEALRKFQAHVRVQGEAQKVERLIEAFSQRYCMCNPDVVQQFHNPDTIFILAFAVVLLNTDMYSPNIKPQRKMGLDDFIRNLRGVDDGADIPREMVAGIYERIQQRELRSNEDHVTYVSRVEQSILGLKTILAVPHRRLVCCCRLFEVPDANKPHKQKLSQLQREVFLFNDLLLILKLCPKKKSSASYTFCKAMGLLGMQFHLFSNEYYAHGITMLSPFTSEKKQLVSFCSPSGEELRKFAEELREAITEVNEMEQIHIQWELERQQGIQPHGIHTNGGQVDTHTGHGSPSGQQDPYDKTGNNNTVEVSAQAILFSLSIASTASVALPASLMNEFAPGVQGGRLNEGAYGKSVYTGVLPAHRL
ncbi:IQ motif and SEC7 domain-containing protein 3 [Morone saxatilis]|uniref:IQ motif and SEC7 domain-containing protein 3 n=1 Tax=Morone saxatilis TaxID=34816 RepID=UPI0015E24FCB|nr:IQ motif and SEC7 domain-containing protein 3 [Morone saxatilis]